MKNTNIYKVALITGAMTATGFAFASYSGGITLPTQSIPSYPQTAIEQKDTEAKDDAVMPKTSTASVDKKDVTEVTSDENGKETKDDAVKLPVGAISEDAAKKAVLAANPQAQIVGVETENENGTIDYNISLKDGTDVKVDVIKGTILATDKRGDEGKIDSDKETKDDSIADSDKETNDDSTVDSNKEGDKEIND